MPRRLLRDGHVVADEWSYLAETGGDAALHAPVAGSTPAAGSIDVARLINERFDDYDYLYDLGELDVKMSGCMNACGHHHVGHIGILGVDKGGEEWYQITIGGAAGADASLGTVIGPSVAKAAVPETIARLLAVYVEQRTADERFLDTVRRLGVKPFKERVYAAPLAA